MKINGNEIRPGNVITHKGGLWVARVDRESSAREGDRVELTVHPRRLHFFAPETGAAIYS